MMSFSMLPGSGRREGCATARAFREVASTDTRLGHPPAKNRFCNNYNVTSTRLCLFNHTRPRALSMTCKLAIFIYVYIFIRTLLTVHMFHAKHLYVQWNAAS